MIRKHILIFIAALLLFAGLLAASFISLYNASRENLVILGEKNAIQAAQEFTSLLKPSVDDLEDAAFQLDTLMWGDATTVELRDYLEEASARYSRTVDKVHTGLYGVFNTMYLDGSGWEPTLDYEAKSRPWYIKAVEKKGEVALISPYVDSKTAENMMSVSRLLSDGRSVVALDVRLDEVREMMKGLVSGSTGGYVMILDQDGYVIAHSDESESGNNYLSQRGTMNGVITQEIFLGKNNQFEINYNKRHYLIYAELIYDQWYAISVMEESAFIRSHVRLFVIATLIIIFAFSMITLAFVNIEQRRKDTENLNLQLQSLASIYMSMHLLNLETDTLYEIRGGAGVFSESIHKTRENGRNLLKRMMEFYTDENSKSAVFDFIDFDRLDERLAENNTITREFLNNKNIWCRARFVVVERNEEGKLKRVLWMVEVIDKEKRLRDQLQYLSETDGLTGISNRGSGEGKIRQLIASGQGGMFILLDADHFKSINDTYGHGVGDKVLIAIAHCLKNCFRENDVVMRLGGDEFAAFAPIVYTKDAGSIIIERFFDHINRIHIAEMEDRKIAVSVGVSFYKKTDTFPFEELYRRADVSTYKSKKTEGNQATFYEETEDNA